MKLTPPKYSRLDQFKNTVQLFSNLSKALTPPPKITIDEWAEKHRILSSEETASPGPWFNDSRPYLVEIMRAISDINTEQVVVLTASQLGKSSACILNTLGYHISYDPCPIMIIQPTVDMAETFSSKRLSPMLRDSAILRDKMPPEKAKTTGNTMLEKSFPGGYVVLAGANSAPSLVARPIRILLFDEVDQAPLDLAGQGDPVKLAKVRTTSFPNRKIVLTSTPTIKGRSRIEKAYNNSTKERWIHQCPSCGEWSQFNWQLLNFESLKMACAYCNTDHTRTEWLKNGGKWLAQNPEHEVRGFHINALDSLLTWNELINEWLEAQETAKRGDFELLKVFINTRLAETWEERGEVVEGHKLEETREVYKAELPDGVCILTMGVDVQDNRLAYEVVGWGLGYESWGIEYGEIWKDPKLGGVWDDIDALLERPFSYANGKTLKIARAAVDTGGHLTPQVYAYCRARYSRGVIAIKGQGGDKLPLIRPSKTNAEKGLFLVGVDGIKSDLFTWLKSGIMGEGLCHFPKKLDGMSARGYITDYFTMLTAEKKVYVRNRNTGFGKYEWHKEAGKRNESLDCRVYARAALRICSARDDLLLSNLNQKALWLNNGVTSSHPSINGLANPKVIPSQNNHWQKNNGHKNNSNQQALNNAITL
jgi:phage terminase large subunit GpA-like protein